MSPGDTWLAYNNITRKNHAQRRPGREPRRHLPGAPRARTACLSLNEGRDVSPGDTPWHAMAGVRRKAALNEGRDVSPGDTDF